jgi:SAM-dependent methyltransferase
MPGAETFLSSADAYERHVGRYGSQLATALIDFAGAEQGMRALDVGCGTGALTAVLAERLGADCVSGADPSQAFVDACRARLPGVEVVLAGAEQLPFGDGTFEVVLSQLVVNFMVDPLRGAREMARVAGRDRRLLCVGLRRRDDSAASVLGRRPRDRTRRRRHKRRRNRDALVRRGRARRAMACRRTARRAVPAADRPRQVHKLRRSLVSAPARRRTIRSVLQSPHRPRPRRAARCVPPSARSRRPTLRADGASLERDRTCSLSASRS